MLNIIPYVLRTQSKNILFYVIAVTCLTLSYDIQAMCFAICPMSLQWCVLLGILCRCPDIFCCVPSIALEWYALLLSFK